LLGGGGGARGGRKLGGTGAGAANRGSSAPDPASSRGGGEDPGGPSRGCGGFGPGLSAWPVWSTKGAATSKRPAFPIAERQGRWEVPPGGGKTAGEKADLGGGGGSREAHTDLAYESGGVPACRAKTDGGREKRPRRGRGTAAGRGTWRSIQGDRGTGLGPAPAGPGRGTKAKARGGRIRPSKRGARGAKKKNRGPRARTKKTRGIPPTNGRARGAKGAGAVRGAEGGRGRDQPGKKSQTDPPVPGRSKRGGPRRC